MAQPQDRTEDRRNPLRDQIQRRFLGTSTLFCAQRELAEVFYRPINRIELGWAGCTGLFEIDTDGYPARFQLHHCALLRIVLAVPRAVGGRIEMDGYMLRTHCDSHRAEVSLGCVWSDVGDRRQLCPELEEDQLDLT